MFLAIYGENLCAKNPTNDGDFSGKYFTVFQQKRPNGFPSTRRAKTEIRCKNGLNRSECNIEVKYRHK